MIQDKIRELVQYGLLTGLVSAEDEIYTTNRLLELFRERAAHDLDNDRMLLER